LVLITAGQIIPLHSLEILFFQNDSYLLFTWLPQIRI